MILRLPNVDKGRSVRRSVPTDIGCEIGKEGERFEFKGGVVEGGGSNDFPDGDALGVDSGGETFRVGWGGEEESSDDCVGFEGSVESDEMGDESARARQLVDGESEEERPHWMW